MSLTCDGAMDLGAILQFNGDSLMTEFHQKPVRTEQNHNINTCSFKLSPQQPCMNINTDMHKGSQSTLAQCYPPSRNQLLVRQLSAPKQNSLR